MVCGICGPDFFFFSQKVPAGDGGRGRLVVFFFFSKNRAASGGGCRVPLFMEEPKMPKKILPVTVVCVRGRFEVRLAGRLIRIRTTAGTWMDARFDTREAAEGYRRVLVGRISPDPSNPSHHGNGGTPQESEISSGRCEQEPAQDGQAFGDQGRTAGDANQGPAGGASGSERGGERVGTGGVLPTE